jgi:hypothetical protein
MNPTVPITPLTPEDINQFGSYLAGNPPAPGQPLIAVPRFLAEKLYGMAQQATPFVGIPIQKGTGWLPEDGLKQELARTLRSHALAVEHAADTVQEVTAICTKIWPEIATQLPARFLSLGYPAPYRGREVGGQ